MKFFFTIILFLKTLSSIPQNLSLPNENSDIRTALKNCLSNEKINAQAVVKLIKSWNIYPKIIKKDFQYLTYRQDSIFGQVPFRVYIPEGYNETQKTGVIVLLHGAVTGSSFEDLKNPDKALDDDIFFNFYKKTNYIIVRPKADNNRKFNWVINDFSGSLNQTFNSITSFITHLKEVLNIDDSKVFCVGHSDGADGTFGFDVYQPDLFSSFVCYNSMLSLLFAKDIFLNNAINSPIYIIHSDKDILRPIEQTRVIINELDSLKVQYKYKEYKGYEHYDKHLELDLPNALNFTNHISRNPFTKKVFWETDNNIYNECKWIKIIKLSPNSVNANWHTQVYIPSYERRSKRMLSQPYYYLSNSSGAIRGNYTENQFTIETSKIREFEIRISEEMVELNKPVKIVLNDKKVFDEKINYNKNYIITSFLKNFDRQALWINNVKINVDKTGL